MNKFSKWIAEHSKLIVIISVILLIPAIIGYVKTRINYDILVYLPESVDTIKGENILTDEFGIGAYAFVLTNEKNNKEILALENKIKEIEDVNAVFSLIDVVDTTIPISMLPEEITEKLYVDNETIIMVTFNGSTSEDKTITAVRELRDLVEDANSVSSMTSMVIDTMDLSDSEITIYIVIAVLFCLTILILATDSYIVPIFLLLNIGVAILYNMGSNIFLGEISYITKAISAILQLGVTTDFSIFLYHKYEETKKKKGTANKKEAMAQAIEETFKSVIGSSLTTFAGFLALCTMDLSLGTDIGLVMAKGVLWGFICVLTLFPSLLLVFGKVIEKTKHKNIFPKFKRLGNWVVNHNKIILVIFILLLFPAIYGNAKVESYYKLDDALPDDLAFKVANTELSTKFGITSPEIILVDSNLKTNEIDAIVEEIKEVEGIDFVIAPSTLIEKGMMSLLPEELTQVLASDKYQLILANSTFEIASNELNNQVDIINDIVKKYDQNGIIAGEGALMKDLVEIADHDFKMVNYTSIIVIFIIMLFVLKQIGLPIILVLTIEFAIFLNMSVAYYTKVSLPFIASIVVGTIQLGATIDYAILMSTRYLDERKTKEKKDAMKETLSFTIPSIVTSALCFFAATFGVAIYTKIDMIGSICELLARGSIISMLVVILILPSLLILFDKIIYKNKKQKEEKKEGRKMSKKVLASILIGTVLLIPNNVLALEKNETVYTNLDHTGTVYQETVNNHLYISEMGDIEDTTELQDILNLTGDEKFELSGNKLKWKATARDIIYSGSSKLENPLTFNITYYLNNEETKLEDMIGKSGDIKIVINITNHSYTYKNSKKLYTPFVVMLGTYLNTEENSNVSITTGKVVDTGTRYMLIGISSPGLYESTNISDLKDFNQIELNYTTTNFKASDYYLVATPKLLEDLDLEVFQKLNTFSSSINLLSDSMNELETGASALADGALELKDGSNVISTSLKNAYDAISKLSDGSKKIDENLNLVLSSLKEVEANLNNKNISGSLANLNELKNGNISAINKLTTTNSSLQEKYLTYELNTYENSTSLINALTLAGYDEGTMTSLVTLKETYEGNASLIYLLNKNNEAMDSMISSLTNISTEIETMIQELSNALTQIENGSSTLSNGLNELESGIKKLYQGSVSLNNGTISLSDGASTLSEGIHTINEEGIKKLVSYTNMISSTTSRLEDLVELSKEYNGYSSDNATNTTFIYKVNHSK